MTVWGEGCCNGGPRDIVDAGTAVALQGSAEQTLLPHLLHQSRVKVLVAVRLSAQRSDIARLHGGSGRQKRDGTLRIVGCSSCWQKACALSLNIRSSSVSCEFRFMGSAQLYAVLVCVAKGRRGMRRREVAARLAANI